MSSFLCRNAFPPSSSSFRFFLSPLRPFAVRAAGTSAASKPQVFSDYVPKRRTEYIPYTGRGLGKLPAGFILPDGYRGNHDYYGISGFFKILFFNKPEWGGQFYYLKRASIQGGKILFFLLLWTYVVDPYSLKKLKARIRTRKAKLG